MIRAFELSLNVPVEESFLYQPVCSWCSSARVPVQGPYARSLVCVMKKGRPVAPNGGSAECFSADEERGEFGPLPLEH